MDFTLLLVDDDEMCLRVHKKIFEITQFHKAPQTFNSAKGALDFISALAGITIPILLVLDINMPVMNGWDLLDFLHRENFTQEIYIVMASSSIDKSDREKAFSFSKVIGFIEKPFDRSVPEKVKAMLPWK